jgi:hypothetical protein
MIVSPLDLLQSKSRQVDTGFDQAKQIMAGFCVGPLQMSRVATGMPGARKILEDLEPKSGLEPETCRLRIGCSTN